MPLSLTLATAVLLTIIGFSAAFMKARTVGATGDGRTLHSLPKYHGYLLALTILTPCVVVILLWLALEPVVLDRIILANLPETLKEASAGRLGLLIGQVRQVAAGVTFGEPDPAVFTAAETFQTAANVSRWLLLAVVVAIALIASGVVVPRIDLRFRARNTAERIIKYILIFCATISILVTLGILFSLLFEGLRFFAVVSPLEFFFGINWDPQIAIRPDQVGSTGAFGAVPIFAGTLIIALTAMVVALPVGLFSAIYMAEFASQPMRTVVKPLIEVLAGIPTIVYGFFAVLVVSPAIRGFGSDIGIPVSPTAAIVPGLVMGVMIIPFISSLADDAISAVPRAMRDGSLGLGATRGETITKVILPSALPGIVGGVLLATSRAIGETMIVVMAAGLTANLTANPLEGVTTVTVQIVALLTGDTSFDSPKTLAAFGLGLTLFLMTLMLNLVAIQIVRKYREQYD